MNYIELFAGCGGLSLGLQANRFEMLLANELSPMAAESFAYNFFNEDFEELAKNDQKPKRTIWLNSNFDSLLPRLRENPFTFPAFDELGYSEMPSDRNNLKGKLIVGSIVELNRLLDAEPKFQKLLQSGFNSGKGLDLVSGGPPCQSFSMAGLRQQNCSRNTLPWEFAKFVEMTKPRIAMLENVTGILRAFKDQNGKQYHAWYEVAKAFASVGYAPLCLHINARLAGVPQNRPRFIMLALRYDFYEEIISKLKPEDASFSLLSPSGEFYKLVMQKGTALEFGFLDYFDTMKKQHQPLFANSFLKPLVSGKTVTVKEALDDLRFKKPIKPSQHVKSINKLFNWLPKQAHIANHEPRANSPRVQRRFRLYQVLQEIDDNNITRKIFEVLKGNASTLEDYVWDTCKQHKYLKSTGELDYFREKHDFIDFLRKHATKKQTQKALNPNAPAPAALSIPDDACHYDDNEPRVLTVREMARIQAFPDNFVFKSKVTTGGSMRKFEVPQYTQVGNAVPPLLAKELGLCLANLLSLPHKTGL